METFEEFAFLRFAMTKQRHLIRAGIYQHVFQRSFDRHIIFTSAVDAIFFVSVYYVYSLKYRVETLAFCLMDNHVHFLCKTEKPSDLNAFVRDYSSVFVKGYNAYHKRIGELFQKPFGYAGKVGDKKLRTCVIYINNNPVEAGKTSEMEQYIWNLFSFGTSKNPFSEQIVHRKASKKMRRSIKEIKSSFNQHKILKPMQLECLFAGLSNKEKQQLRDYILKEYSPVNYEKVTTIFGSLGKAIIAMHSFMGSEYDIKM